MLFEEKNIIQNAEKKTQKKKKLYANNKDCDIKILDKFELNSDTISTEINDQKTNEKPKEFNLCTFYIKNLSEKVLLQYGSYYLKSFNLKDNFILPEDFMKNHKISTYMRSKMVNWMLEIFYTFRSNEETFLAAVEIMDKFIYYFKKKTLTDENIHLIGMVSIYIASKVYDLIPIQLDNIIHQIGHEQFTQKQILLMERRIIKNINFDVFSVNSFDLIRFFLYDFYVNNKESFMILKCEKYMDMLTNCTIWIYKMCKHYEQYSSVRPVFLSLACLLIGYDFMRDNCDSFTGEIKDFFKQWLSLLFSKVGKKKEIREKIETIYKNIQKTYSEYRESNFKNLILYQELYFD